MADSNRLRLTVAYYNLHGFNQGKILLSLLCDTCRGFGWNWTNAGSKLVPRGSRVRLA